MIGNQEKLSVVVADDHPIVLSGLRGLLSAIARFEVIAAYSNGDDALQGLRELEPQLAVIDIRMPQLTGVEILERIAGDGLRTRVVLLTASPTDDQIVQAVTHGAWGIMLKDAAADELVDCLERVVVGERWLPSELVSPALSREAGRCKDVHRLQNLLTPREREVALFVAQGLSNKQIARKVNISEGTVKIHLHKTYQKLGVGNRTSLSTLVQRHLAPSAGSEA
jgi:DNA-binding NarL/FixJ family response regulator